MDAEVMDLAKGQAALCSVFANPKRVLILWSLAEHEKPVTAISHAIDASLQNTSQHLSLMKAAGILEAEKGWPDHLLPHRRKRSIRKVPPAVRGTEITKQSTASQQLTAD